MPHQDARDLALSLNPELLRPLFKLNPIKHSVAIVYNWGVILTAAYLAANYLNIFTYFLAIIVIGARMHALAVLMHDASHYRFIKNRYWNDLITNVTTMYPLFLTVEKYRINHLAHHKHLNTEEDPDWVSKLPKKEFQFPKTRQAFILGILSYFLLVQGVKDAIWFVTRFNVLGTNKHPTKKQSSKQHSKWWQLLFYGILITTLSICSLWKFFFLFWIIPYFSTFLMFQYIRSVSEHFGDLEYDHLLSSSRTVTTNVIEQFLIAPHNVNYHIEHHLYPGVPYYNLPKLHQLLLETPIYQKHAHVTKGYMSGVLKELT